jgi:uncharacterized protein (TIGR02145 family)/uncharacterized repeat protein (TIGR02543 family)
MIKSIFKAVAVSAVAAFFCVGCGDKNSGGEEPGDNPGEDGGTTSSYTVTFNPNGGTVNPTSAETDEDGKLDSLPTPTRKGYIFDGWYTAKIGGTAVTDSNAYAANAEIYARWTVVYTITFDANSGTVNPTSAETGKDGKLDSLPAPTREGYIFDGWFMAQKGGPKVTAEGVYTADATIYARWTAVYTITFNAGGGTVSPTSAVTGTDGKLTSLPTPTRDGYIFDGWYTASTDGTVVTTSTVFTANAIVYARWTEITVTPPIGNTFVDSRDSKTYKKVTIGTQTWMAQNLNYDVPGVTTDVCYDNDTSNCVTYGRLYDWNTALTACPTGWHLPIDAEWTTLIGFVGTNAGTKLKSSSGWNRNGNGTNDVGFSALPGGYYSDGNFLYAGGDGRWWSATGYDASNAKQIRMVDNDEDVILGNYDKARLYSVRCVEGAVATPTTYTITFDANGGTVSPTSAKTDDGGKLTNLPTPERSGYGFGGWYTAQTGGTEVTVNRVHSENTTIYARWAAVYTITFNANGGTVSPASAVTGTGGMLAALPTTTRNGYTFEGWYTAQTGGTRVTTSTVFGWDVTIYAQWVVYAYTGRTVKIGNQTWMAQNLDNVTADSKCYGNSADNCSTYGRLYTWDDALIACPTGWHLPTDAEWTTLTDAVGGLSAAGTKLKSSGWSVYPGNPASTDEYGFSALPGGRGRGNSEGNFEGVGLDGYWWSATENSASRALGRWTGYYYSDVYTSDYDKADLLSIRCVQGAATYTITFNGNGGTVSPTSATTGADGKLASLPTPTRGGYTFDGWYTALTGGTEVAASRVYTANATIYARWTEIPVTPSTYTIEFDGNGGSGSVSDVTANAGSAITLPSGAGLTKAGYTFDGWNTNSSGTGTNYSAGASYTVTGNATLFAKWTAVPVPPDGYTITFDLNDGTGRTWSATTNGSLSSSYFTNPQERSGYTFIAWAMNYDGGMRQVNAYTVFTANTTILALWKVDPTPTITTFTDSRDDNKTYKKVAIGNQVWMAENLNYQTANSVCYDNNSSNCATYGRLYNWDAAMTACPTGWHLPTFDEWKALWDNITLKVGNSLKSTSGWDDDGRDGSGTDEYGFAALPGGLGGGPQYDNVFNGAGTFGSWWDATETTSGYAGYWQMYGGTDNMSVGSPRVSSMLRSVRCVQD